MDQEKSVLRAVVLGAGGAGHLHAMVYRTLGVEILGAYDPDPIRSAVFAQTHLCNAASSEDELFEMGADLISITTPPAMHIDQAIKAQDHSLIALVEKPVIVSLADLERASKLDRAVPVVQWRYGRAFQQLKAVYEAGYLGDSPSFVGDLAWYRDAEYFSSGRSSKSVWGAGALLSVGIHMVDLVSALLGPPVYSSGVLKMDERSDMESAAIAMFTFKNDALATVRVSLNGGRDSTSLTVCGNGVTGRLDGGGNDPTSVSFIWNSANTEIGENIQELCGTLTTNDTPPLLMNLIDSVIQALRSRAGFIDSGIATMADVLPAHEAILNIYEKRNT